MTRGFLFKRNSTIKNEKGLTLVEVLVSITILSIIVVTFLTFFIQSSKTNNVSQKISESIYVAQTEMEEIYNLSNTVSYIYAINTLIDNNTVESIEGGYIFSKYDEDYKINSTITSVWDKNDIEITDLKSILVEVYNSDNKLEAQVESKLLWGN